MTVLVVLATGFVTGSAGRGCEPVTVLVVLATGFVTGSAGRGCEPVTVLVVLATGFVTSSAGRGCEPVTVLVVLATGFVTGSAGVWRGHGCHVRRSSVPSAASRPARRVARAESDADHRPRSSASISRSQMVRRAHGLDCS